MIPMKVVIKTIPKQMSRLPFLHFLFYFLPLLTTSLYLGSIPPMDVDLCEEFANTSFCKSRCHVVDRHQCITE